jgi:hypothetical protein
MTTGSWRIGVGSGFGMLFGSIVLICFVDFFDRFLSGAFFGRFFQARLKRPFVPKVSELPLAFGFLESTALGTLAMLTGCRMSTDYRSYLSRSPGRF